MFEKKNDGITEKMLRKIKRIFFWRLVPESNDDIQCYRRLFPAKTIEASRFDKLVKIVSRHFHQVVEIRNAEQGVHHAKHLKIIHSHLATILHLSVFCFRGDIAVPDRCYDRADKIKCVFEGPILRATMLQEGSSVAWRNQATSKVNCAYRATVVMESTRRT